MALLSLAIPLVKAYLASKMQSLGQNTPNNNLKLLNFIFWVLIISGALFGLISLYEYYSETYTHILAKAYMSITLIALAVGGWLGCLIIKGIRSTFHKKPTISNELNSAEEYIKTILHTIEAEGEDLIKHHPLATVLGALCLGVLSGTIVNTKGR
jgi:hypothetical protein